MFGWISYSIFALYLICAVLLVLYGLNCHIVVFLYLRGRKNAAAYRKAVRERFEDLMSRPDIPKVTTQIPIFNEVNVAERAMRAACGMQYPAGLHEIQILDDSTDETSRLIDDLVPELRRLGHNIRVIRRSHRRGFKAGALSEGLRMAGGELLAVFDADFVPPSNYLLKVLPFFMDNSRTGVVQTRWGHLNCRGSLLTRAQAMGIDGHFMVEQAARNWNGLFMNFNGTAGVWRRQAIQDAGGWQWDTLTEDMDLSYRAQFAGWQTVFLPDVVVPAELPEDVNAFKSQQFRWAKGSIQTARKLLPSLLAMDIPRFKKLQAVFHLTHYMVHPLMLILALLSLPVLWVWAAPPVSTGWSAPWILVVASMLGPNTLYITSQRAAHPHWKRRLAILPFLCLLGVGLAISNSRAVAEALMGKPSDFIRTPKRGDRELKAYRLRLPGLPFLEILLGLYCALSFGINIGSGKLFIVPFTALYASGLLFIGLLTALQDTKRFR